MAGSDTSGAVAASAGEGGAPRRTKTVRVRKDRDGGGGAAAAPADAARVMTSYGRTARAAGVAYAALLVLRFALALAPGVVEPAESMDGADVLAAAILPGMRGVAAEMKLPEGMYVERGEGVGLRDVRLNYTRSIVGAFVTSGIPYMGVSVACEKVPFVGRVLCSEGMIGYVATYAPRVWMALLSVVGDVMLVNVFAVYNSEFAVSGLLTYASSWMTLLLMARNTNFALEGLCLLGLLSSCFGWTYRTPRPLFWISATALALGVFLRPVFAVFVCTPLIFLVSLWGKQGVDPLRYARAAIEGIAVFGFWVSVWVSVDSVFFGSFRLRFGTTFMESFDMFVEYATLALAGGADSPGKLSYKGFLIYAPLNASRGVVTKAFWGELFRNTSPGQMFIQLPMVLGPLMFLLIRESIDGMKVAMKELMGELKAASGDKKKKKKKSKSGMSKEREEEMLVYYDTIQTTLLLGLLLEVMQNHERIGLVSLLALNGPALLCVAPFVFGENGVKNARLAHLAYSLAMVLFYGLMHQSGVSRLLLSAGAGGVPAIPPHSDLVVYRGAVHYPASALGANVKGLRVHDGGQTRADLMTTLRDVKGGADADEARVLVCAAGTIDMREEFELVHTTAFGHMTTEDLPENLDSALGAAKLHVYKFVGDEDEALIRDREEAAEREEEENANRRSRRDR